jgi:hypothetical protein
MSFLLLSKMLHCHFIISLPLVLKELPDANLKELQIQFQKYYYFLMAN